MRFFRYPLTTALPCEGIYLLLSLEAEEELSCQDEPAGLILIDATWRWAMQMQKTLVFPNTVKLRALPRSLRTAYPRRQNGCSRPDEGLASIEALAAAYHILGRPFLPLLEHYYWKQAFLKKNQEWFDACRKN